MPLIKLERKLSIKDTYINPDEIIGIIQEIQGERLTWYILIRSNAILYDVTEKFAKKLIQTIGVMEI